MKFYTSGGTKTKVEYKIPQNNMTKVSNYKNMNNISKSNIINSYASKNPSLFGTGVSSNTTKKGNIDRTNMGNMLGRLTGLRTGCSSCGKK
jgi:hypothetical protein